MVTKTISWCITNRLVVFAGTIAVSLWGFWAVRHVPIDAIPDLSDVQVIVSTEWPGRSPDLVEAQVTYPIVTALLSMAHVRSVRGMTDFGVSFVYVIFDDSTELYWARSRVLERLQALRAGLPDGVTPTMAPDATGAGWIFEYALVDETGQHALDELRSLQDWTLRYALASVSGVAEIASIGGFVKQYQVNLDPRRLAALNLSSKDVVDAIRASNDDVDGRLLEFAGREYIVRARGSLTSIQDIEQVAVKSESSGSSIRVADVADVRLGPDIRRGIAELEGRGEVVGGIVIMRAGENALDVIDRVKVRLAEIQRTLPDGVLFVPVYDRSDLIKASLFTLRRVLIETVIIVLLVILVFLFQVRSALVPIITLPIAVLASFIPLAFMGVTANIMSLGGIALAVGVFVDAAIVMTENGYRRLVEEPAPAGSSRIEIVSRAAHQIGRGVFFSLAVIVVSFMPVFLLQSQEGRLFRPLALTKTFGAAAATLFAITLVPSLMATLMNGPPPAPRRPNAVTRFCAALYEPVLRLALRRKWTFLIVNGLVVPVAALLVPTLGREFMPPLYEGSLLYMPTAPPGLAATETIRLLQTQDRVLSRFPEVERVFGTAGRATTATDNSPMGMVNTTVLLKPRHTWRPGLTLESLQAQMDAELQIPGVPNIWTQPIRSRLDMLFTGIKTPVGVKILGSDLHAIQEIGGQIESVLRSVQGTRSVYAERAADGNFVDIRLNRAAVARHGLTVSEVEAVVATAIGGTNIGHTVEGRQRYPVNVRYQYDFRGDLEALKKVRVKAASGAQVVLGQLADVVVTTGPTMIRDEDGLLAGYVYVETDTRDIGGYVERAQRAVDTRVSLPAGYRLSWSGQYEFHLRAVERLRLIIPATLLTIFVLLHLAFGSAIEALIVMLSVIYAMTGGILLQWLIGYHFSVAVWVGYIALYGIAVQTGVIMVMYLHEAVDRRLQEGEPLTEADLREATVAGAVLRLRPKLMTVAATTVGLLPILMSRGIGSDVLKPIAAPMLGGMVTSAVHVLIITPLLFHIMKQRALRLRKNAA